jgi:hypothetical protein
MLVFVKVWIGEHALPRTVGFVTATTKQDAPRSRRGLSSRLLVPGSDRVSVTRAAHQPVVGMLGLNMCDGLTMKAGSAACPHVARMRSLSCAIAISRSACRRVLLTRGDPLQFVEKITCPASAAAAISETT